MAIPIQGGVSGATADVDATHDALRVSMRPLEVTGAYRLSTTNGATGVAAGASADAEVFAFRNPSATKTAIVRKVTLDMWTGATGFAAGVSLFYMKAARSFTAAPTAGTTVTLTTNNCKLSTGHETAACAAFVHDDSVLTSGTETADTTALGYVAATTTTGVQTVHIADRVLYDAKDAAYPLECAQDEGFIIYATVPGTGVWFARYTVEWEEVLNATF